jgi:hypothetical protein
MAKQHCKPAQYSGQDVRQTPARITEPKEGQRMSEGKDKHGRAENLTPDPRTPAQLATAILEHPFSPRINGTGQGALHPVADLPSRTFRQRLDESRGGKLRYVGALLHALHNLEAGAPLRASANRDLSRALQIINEIRDLSVDERDSCAQRLDSNKTPKNKWQQENQSVLESLRVLAQQQYGSPTDADRKHWYDNMEASMVEISNLKSIEKLTRALANRLGLPLIEPGRHR